MNDRCSRYAARLDAYLATLSSAKAKRIFLAGEAAKWRARYATWCRDVDRGSYRGDATAADFHVTMADIDARAARFSEKEAA